VRVLDKGAGTFDDCEITANALAGVEIKQNEQPDAAHVPDTRRQAGRRADRENGLGTLEECVIAGQARWRACSIKQASDPVLRRCRSTTTATSASHPREGQGPLEECDVFENALAGVEVRAIRAEVKKCKVHDGKQAGPCGRRRGRGRI